MSSQKILEHCESFAEDASSAGPSYQSVLSAGSCTRKMHTLRENISGSVFKKAVLVVHSVIHTDVRCRLLLRYSSCNDDLLNDDRYERVVGRGPCSYSSTHYCKFVMSAYLQKGTRSSVSARARSLFFGR